MNEGWFLNKVRNAIGLGGTAAPVFPVPSEEAGPPWSGEKLYYRGDDYFREILRAVDRASQSVDFETYIFENCLLGDQMIASFLKAARRGVKVRLLVDGIGSPDFASHYGPRLLKGKVLFRVYRPWHAFLKPSARFFSHGRIERAVKFLVSFLHGMNRRDHRKLCLVDGERAWLGSFNVSDSMLESIAGKKAWRETGIRLSKVRTKIFALTFLAAWEERSRSRLRRVYRRVLIQWISRHVPGGAVRVNVTRRLRRSFLSELLDRFGSTRKRLWITTPYFIPPRALVKALIKASRAGCDVRLLVPGVSDVPMVRWASMTFYPRLLKAGCRIFEYRERMLHAKTLIMDSQGWVGSNNLNHRSLLHDLEINVILQEKGSLLSLEERFQRDQRESGEVTLTEARDIPLWTWALSRVLFQFRYWL